MFAEIQDISIPTAIVRRKLAKLTQLNECIADLLQAIIKDTKPTEPKGLHPVGTMAKAGDMVRVIDNKSIFAIGTELICSDPDECLYRYPNGEYGGVMSSLRYVIIEEAQK